MRCEALNQRLSEAGADAVAMEGEVAEHVASCLRCQAELARYRRLHAELAGLGVDHRGGPHADGLLDEILMGLDRAVVRRANARRAGQVAGSVAATGALLGVIVILIRVRNRRLGTG